METGDVWRGWTIDSLIGEGSFGKVYKAVRREFGHTYESALKVIRVPQSGAEVEALKNEGMSDSAVELYYQSLVEDIASEVALLSKLKGNTNIVSYEDHEVIKLTDEFGWEIYIRMELLTPLYKYVDEHPMSEKDIVRMGADICGALEVCEKFNIIHRDIKPENIFVSSHGRFKLGDFGIAKQMDLATAALSKKGTPAYMAPEVYREEPYDASVDRYSLGIVLYKFANEGRTPFLPPAPKPIRFQDKDKATVRRMRGDKLPKPCNADEGLAKIILKACAFKPKDRYASASEMKADLEALYPELAAEMTVREPSKKKKWVIPLAAAAAVLAVCVGIFAFSGGSDNITTPYVVGMSEEEAKEAIEAAGLVYAEEREFSEETAQGTVMSESVEDTELAEGTPVKVKEGTEVKVVVSRGKPITAPTVVRKSVTKATELAEKKGLTIEVAGEDYSDYVTKGGIIEQDPEAGGDCESGQAIKVIVSLGVKEIEVPDVTGMYYTEAQEVLKDAELDYVILDEFSDEVESGYVIGQTIAPGTMAKHLAKIPLRVSKGPDPNGGSGD